MSPSPPGKNLKLDQELENPCFKEHMLSLKCLDHNNYNKEACTSYFLNYQNCKMFWSKVVSDRKRKGIKPYLPIPADRPKIKEEYLSKEN